MSVTTKRRGMKGLDDDDFSLDSDFSKDYDNLNDGNDYDSKEDYNDLMDDYGDSQFFDGAGFQPPIEKHADLLKELTNFNKYVRDKINGWLGLVWSESKGVYVRNPAIEPLMNVKCAAWCIDFLKTYTRDNNIITNIPKDEYNNFNEDIIDVLWLNLGTRSEEFGIKQNGDIMRICVEMQHAAVLVLMGAGDGKYNQLLSTVTQRSEAVRVNTDGYGNPIMQHPNQQKQSFFNKVKEAFRGVSG